MTEQCSFWFELMYDGELNPLPHKFEELNIRPELRELRVIQGQEEAIVYFDSVQNRLRVFIRAE